MTKRRISRRRGKGKVGSRGKEFPGVLSRKVGIVVGAVLVVIAAGALWGTIDRLLWQRRSPQRDKRSVGSQQPYEAAPPRQRESLSAEPKLTPEELDRSLRKEQLEIARRLMATFPDNANAAFLMGMAYLEQNNVVEAVKHLERSLELQPDRADAYDHLGRVALAKGEYDRAVTLFRKALENDPKIHSTHFRIARALVFLGNHEEAILELQRDIEIFPEASGSYYLLGETYLKLRDYQKAKTSYEAAIEVRPDLMKAYYGLATVCARLKLKNEAKQYREKFKELEAEDRKVGRHWRQVFDPLKVTRESFAHTCTDIGRVYQAQGYRNGAEQILQRAATVDPNNLTCRFELAALYQQTQRFSDALTLCEQITDIEPENGANYFTIGNLNAQLNRFDAAEKAYKKVIEIAPKRAEGYRGLAELYLKFNRNRPQTKTLASKAVELEPTAVNYFVLAGACEKNGDRAGSLGAAERATKLEPNNTRYRKMYRLIQEKR